MKPFTVLWMNKDRTLGYTDYVAVTRVAASTAAEAVRRAARIEGSEAGWPEGAYVLAVFVGSVGTAAWLMGSLNDGIQAQAVASAVRSTEGGI